MPQRNITRSGDYKTFFMLIVAEHEISTAHLNENAQN